MNQRIASRALVEGSLGGAVLGVLVLLANVGLGLLPVLPFIAEAPDEAESFLADIGLASLAAAGIGAVAGLVVAVGVVLVLSVVEVVLLQGGRSLSRVAGALLSPVGVALVGVSAVAVSWALLSTFQFYAVGFLTLASFPGAAALAAWRYYAVSRPRSLTPA